MPQQLNDSLNFLVVVLLICLVVILYVVIVLKKSLVYIEIYTRRIRSEFQFFFNFIAIFVQHMHVQIDYWLQNEM
jgi:hypothetical protein